MAEQKDDLATMLLGQAMGAIFEEKMAGFSAGVDEEAVKGIVEKSLSERLSSVEKVVSDTVSAEMERYKRNAPRKLVIDMGAKKVTTKEELRHERFEDALKIMSAGHHLWLYGPAGTGKSKMAHQLADAIGAKYHYTGAILDEFTGLKGFIDANGTKHGTEFTRALEDAKSGEQVVMCFDECDGSIPEVLITLNNLLSDGAIECMGELYEYTDNLHFVACGNTNGRGGGSEYVRSILDDATLNRFVFMEISYDPKIEDAIAGSEALAKFTRALRDAAESTGTELLVTYRDIAKLATIESVLSMDKAIEYVIGTRLDEGDFNVLVRKLGGSGMTSNKWFKAMKREVA